MKRPRTAITTQSAKSTATPIVPRKSHVYTPHNAPALVPTPRVSFDPAAQFQFTRPAPPAASFERRQPTNSIFERSAPEPRPSTMFVPSAPSSVAPSPIKSSTLQPIPLDYNRPTIAAPNPITHEAPVENAGASTSTQMAAPEEQAAEPVFKVPKRKSRKRLYLSEAVRFPNTYNARLNC